MHDVGIDAARHRYLCHRRDRGVALGHHLAVAALRTANIAASAISPLCGEVRHNGLLLGIGLVQLMCMVLRR